MYTVDCFLPGQPGCTCLVHPTRLLAVTRELCVHYMHIRFDAISYDVMDQVLEYPRWYTAICTSSAKFQLRTRTRTGVRVKYW